MLGIQDGGKKDKKQENSRYNKYKQQIVGAFTASIEVHRVKGSKNL